jgi:CubicO group peptidase (beta-lactamase class C family)
LPNPITRSVLLFLTIYLLGACTSDEASDESQADPILERNLAAYSRQPKIVDIEWRQPKEVVAGNYTDRFELQPDSFPAPDALQAAIDYSRSQQGRGLMVWYDGALVASDFADDLGPEVHAASFSMHKSVLAIAVMQAVEAGVFESIDDPVGRYLAAWRDDPRGQISLRQLLTHTSGLAHHSMDGSSGKGVDLILSSRIRETALSFEQPDAAGETFSYNNVNSQIVGLALEDALAERGQRYAEFLSENLWQPLRNRDAAVWLEKPGGSARFASALEAGLEDWLAVGVMLANNGHYASKRILTEQSVSALLEPSEHNPAYGLSIWRGDAWQNMRSYSAHTPLKVLHSKPYLAPDVYFFDGFGGQRVYFVPSRQLVVARFGEVNLAYDDAAIVNELLGGLQRAEQDAARAAFRSGDVEALYQERFQRLLRESVGGGGLAGYDPLTQLDGAESYQAFTVDPAAADWLDENTRTELSNYLEPRNTQAFLVWHSGELVMAEYFGDNNADSLVISRSLAKPLSVIAIGRALQRGFIESLDQPAAEFISEWRGTDKSVITIRQILQMRSGLEPQRPSLDPDDIMTVAYLHPYHTEFIINDYPLVTEPGTRYDYSNANGELVALLIERITGQRYEDWLSREVLGPIGAKGGSIWLNRIAGTAHSGCCALLPAETWLRLSILLMNDGTGPSGEALLPDGYVQAMGVATPQNPHAGMGVYVAGQYIENRGAANPDVSIGRNYHSEPYLDKDLFLFDGNGNQVSYHIPRHDLIIMRVGTAPPKDVQWDNAFLPNTVLRALAAGTNAELVTQ